VIENTITDAITFSVDVGFTQEGAIRSVLCDSMHYLEDVLPPACEPLTLSPLCTLSPLVSRIYPASFCRLIHSTRFPCPLEPMAAALTASAAQ
jgi:hypothetical protein